MAVGSTSRGIALTVAPMVMSSTKNVAAQSTEFKHNEDTLLDFMITVIVPIIVYINIEKRQEIIGVNGIIIGLASIFLISAKIGLFIWFTIKKYQNTEGFFFIQYLITTLVFKFSNLIVTRFIKLFLISAFVVLNVGLSIQIIFLVIYTLRGYYNNEDYLIVLVPILLFSLCADIRFIWVITHKSEVDNISASTQSKDFEWSAKIYSQTLTVISLSSSVLAMLLLDPSVTWIKLYLTLVVISNTLLYYNIDLNNYHVARVQMTANERLRDTNTEI
ncbi:3507_t:CDS:2 [Cetraspora pellucida]|uniref:3507_t:CDS:1 n=1 Tax=Cetraspora pellucida TaxID=1433469 RepID=A0A9N9N8F2_9GLOM|nr:3507_t:CDS:2 [Cetraspora pellucida]